MLFESLAKEDQETKTASRKAIIAANQRIIDSVGAFIQRSSSAVERDQRIFLVSDDIRGIVVSACADYGGDIEQVEKTVRERLANTCVCGGNGECQCGKKTKKEASTHESRRPRLCPYHKQIVDISLAQGEPKAGYEAMAQHSWSDKHCESDDYGGEKCKFKPEMTTQSYWTDRTDAAREKREEKQRLEQEHEEIQQSPTEPIEETSEPVTNTDTAPATDWESEGGSFEHSEPSAIATEEVTSSLHLAAYSTVQLTDGSGRWKVTDANGNSKGVYDTQQEAQAEANSLNRGLGNQASKQAGPMDQPYPQQQAMPGAQMPAIQPQMQGQPHSQQATPAMQQAQQLMQQGQGQPGQVPPVAPVVPAPGAAQIPPHPNNPGQQQQGVLNQLAPAATQQGGPGMNPPQYPLQQFASTKEAERGNDNLGGPSPKMDKRKWTPENLQQRVNTEGPDSPHPTHEIDIAEPIAQDQSKDQFTKGEDFLDGTRAVTETQDVSKAWKNPGSGATKVFDGAGQVNPVSASVHEAAVSFERRHFNLIADALKNAPGAGSELANHFADRLSDTNANFNRQRFLDAATPEDSEKESSANPLYDILEEDFTDPSQVTSAISQYREE